MISNVHAKKPSWVENPSSCPKQFWCAVGVGFDLSSAQANARKEMASIWESKIIAKFQTTVSEENNNVYTDTRETVQEQVNTVLEGIENQKTFQSPAGKFYVWAWFNKDKYASRLRKQMLEKDAKMRTLLQSDKPGVVLSLEELYKERATLNDKYRMLKTHFFPKQVKLAEIEKLRLRLVENVVFNFIPSEHRMGKLIEDSLSSLLTEKGFQIAQLGKKSFTHQIKIQWEENQLYLKVKGFEKYHFGSVIEVYNKRNEKKVGQLVLDTTAMGRNLKQARSRAWQILKKDLQERISQLNIE